VLGVVLIWAIASGALSDLFGGGDDGGGATTTTASAKTSPPTSPTLSTAPAAPAVPAASMHRFDAPRAMAWARRQVALGPRPAGSPAQRRAAAFLRSALPAGRYVPIGGGLRNITGRLPGRGAPILLVAHYDTTPVPGYLGANNSAAAVGAILELARALRHDRPARPVHFLLTDGEEAPTYPVEGNFYQQGLRGSRHAAARPPRPAAVIVLDFVAQKGLRVRHEPGSDAALWGKLRAAAERVGVGAVFPPDDQNQVLDDHTPFARRGIPAIDLIDFNYPCWQKPCDTLDKLSTRSLDAAGEAVLQLVRTLG
jgi:acetylornithine deacetylase/succinyl-diaminopimelate desuccinylase-like protein